MGVPTPGATVGSMASTSKDTWMPAVPFPAISIASASLAIDLSATPAEGFWVRAQALEKQGHLRKALIDVSRAVDFGIADKEAAAAMKKRLVDALAEGGKD